MSVGESTHIVETLCGRRDSAAVLGTEVEFSTKTSFVDLFPEERKNFVYEAVGRGEHRFVAVPVEGDDPTVR